MYAGARPRLGAPNGRQRGVCQLHEQVVSGSRTRSGLEQQFQQAGMTRECGNDIPS